MPVFTPDMPAHTFRAFKCHFVRQATQADNVDFLRDMLKELSKCATLAPMPASGRQAASLSL